ncbi:MAG: ethanolamine ammonia-lyase subunit EutC [Desulfovibrionaceae bacterium]|nr:ethanolamine ammonia-lyase subunit EutC [Desulfovibrionaceae bacterium]
MSTSPDKKPQSGSRMVVDDPWRELRRFTDARIGLGRCGTSLPVSEWLDFRLSHARARDAVLAAFDAEGTAAKLREGGLETVILDSAAHDMQTFLVRPDLGRKLSSESHDRLAAWAQEHVPAGREPDITLVISNGLSARAAHENAAAFALEFSRRAADAGFRMGPVIIVRNGRVAVADEAASLVRSKITAILIGERPGLSSPNSMGVYLTYGPHPGCTDEARNCISNVRAGGLSIEEGVRKLCYLVQEAVRLKLSGVGLKDDMPQDYLPFVQKDVLESTGSELPEN